MGECVDASKVVYAAPSAPNGTACTQTDPCSITSAVAAVSLARETIKLDPGTYTANISVADKKVIVHGVDAILTSDSGTTLEATNRARLRVLGLSIVSTAASGTAFACQNEVDMPFVELDGVTIDAMGLPFTADACNVSIVRSHVHARADAILVGAANDAVVEIKQTLLDGSAGRGVGAFNGAIISVANSTIVGQSGFDGALQGISGVVLVSFSTIVDSIIKCGTGVASCSAVAPNGVCMDNSIVVNTHQGAPANTISGTRCSVNFSLVQPQITLGGTNNKLGVDPAFVDSSGGNYHLKLDSPAVDAADPAAVNTIDFDGTPRPQGQGNDLGAFERF
jgi:hypothetical protein